MLNTQCKQWVFAVIIAMVSLGCRSSQYQLKGEQTGQALFMPNFSLTTHTEQPFQWRQNMDGDIALLFFGYTYCPDVCPMTLAKLQVMLADMPAPYRERIRVMLITADPERDTPAELANYLSFFAADFVGLTGDKAEIQAVMQSLAVFAEKRAETGNKQDYLVSHTARLYLLTPQGELLVSYPFGFNSEDVKQDLVYLLDQE